MMPATKAASKTIADRGVLRIVEILKPSLNRGFFVDSLCINHQAHATTPLRRKAAGCFIGLGVTAHLRREATVGAVKTRR